jgi:hypothetical protein
VLAAVRLGAEVRLDPGQRPQGDREREALAPLPAQRDRLGGVRQRRGPAPAPQVELGQRGERVGQRARRRLRALAVDDAGQDAPGGLVVVDPHERLGGHRAELERRGVGLVALEDRGGAAQQRAPLGPPPGAHARHRPLRGRDGVQDRSRAVGEVAGAVGGGDRAVGVAHRRRRQRHGELHAARPQRVGGARRVGLRGEQLARLGGVAAAQQDRAPHRAHVGREPGLAGQPRRLCEQRGGAVEVARGGQRLRGLQQAGRARVVVGAQPGGPDVGQRGGPQAAAPQRLVAGPDERRGDLLVGPGGRGGLLPGALGVVRAERRGDGAVGGAALGLVAAW